MCNKCFFTAYNFKVITATKNWIHNCVLTSNLGPEFETSFNSLSIGLASFRHHIQDLHKFRIPLFGYNMAPLASPQKFHLEFCPEHVQHEVVILYMLEHDFAVPLVHRPLLCDSSSDFEVGQKKLEPVVSCCLLPLKSEAKYFALKGNTNIGV